MRAATPFRSEIRLGNSSLKQWGAIIGGVWGLAAGVLGGDSGSQLWTDAIEGGLVGGLAGLTDGASLFAEEGSLGVKLGLYGARAALNVGGEAARQELNYGCITSGTGLVLAGITSPIGDFAGDGVQTIASDAGMELGSLGSGVNAALSRLYRRKRRCF